MWRKILIWLPVVVALYVGVKFLPLYYANSQLKDNIEFEARYHHGDQRLAEPLRDSIYNNAQSYGIPLKREDIQVEVGPSETHITVDYSAPIDLHFFQTAWHFRIQYPDHNQPLSLTDPRFISALGLIFGLFWFFKGFLIFRKYRIVADTPLTPIRGLAMGLVQIRGKAVAASTLLSPVSRQPCYLYRVSIDRWTGGSSGSGRWSPDLVDTAWVKFSLEDETGRVPVDPRGAEYELEQSGQRAISGRPGILPGHAWEAEGPPINKPGFPASESELRSYVSRVARGMRTALYQGADLSSKPDVQSEQSKAQSGILKGLPFLFGMASLTKAGSVAAGLDHSPGDYRLTEQCILPDCSYDITGTCMQNPEAKNDLDNNMIAKGKNAPAFLVSNQSDKEIAGTLRARAMRHILGGGFLAIAFAAALLQTLGIL